MFQILEPAECRDLVTLAEVRCALGITSGAEDEALLAYIGQASAAIESEVNAPLVAETVRQTFRLQRQTSELFLRRWPVQDIQTVIVNGVELDAADYEHDALANTLRRVHDGRVTWWPATTIVVTYVAGYPADQSPDDIKRAAIITLSHYRTHRIPLLRSVEMDGVGARSYCDWVGAVSLPPEAAALCARHRQPSIG